MTRGEDSSDLEVGVACLAVDDAAASHLRDLVRSGGAYRSLRWLRAVARDVERAVAARDARALLELARSIREASSR